VNHQEIKKNLQKVEREFQAKVEALAEQARTALVVPACKKYGVTFHSGMGTFFFERKDDGHTMGSEDEARAAGLFGLAPIFRTLDLDVGRDDLLGHYVRDVT